MANNHLNIDTDDSSNASVSSLRSRWEQIATGYPVTGVAPVQRPVSMGVHQTVSKPPPPPVPARQSTQQVSITKIKKSPPPVPSRIRTPSPALSSSSSNQGTTLVESPASGGSSSSGTETEIESQTNLGGGLGLAPPKLPARPRAKSVSPPFTSPRLPSIVTVPSVVNRSASDASGAPPLPPPRRLPPPVAVGSSPTGSIKSINFPSTKIISSTVQTPSMTTTSGKTSLAVPVKISGTLPPPPRRSTISPPSTHSNSNSSSSSSSTSSSSSSTSISLPLPISTIIGRSPPPSISTLPPPIPFTTRPVSMVGPVPIRVSTGSPAPTSNSTLISTTSVSITSTSTSTSASGPASKSTAATVTTAATTTSILPPPPTRTIPLGHIPELRTSGEENSSDNEPLSGEDMDVYDSEEEEDDEDDTGTQAHLSYPTSYAKSRMSRLPASDSPTTTTPTPTSSSAFATAFGGPLTEIQPATTLSPIDTSLTSRRAPTLSFSNPFLFPRSTQALVSPFMMASTSSAVLIACFVPSPSLSRSSNSNSNSKGRTGNGAEVDLLILASHMELRLFYLLRGAKQVQWEEYTSARVDLGVLVGLEKVVVTAVKAVPVSSSSPSPSSSSLGLNSNSGSGSSSGDDELDIWIGLSNGSLYLIGMPLPFAGGSEGNSISRVKASRSGWHGGTVSRLFYWEYRERGELRGEDTSGQGVMISMDVSGKGVVFPSSGSTPTPTSTGNGTGAGAGGGSLKPLATFRIDRPNFIDFLRGRIWSSPISSSSSSSSSGATSSGSGSGSLRVQDISSYGLSKVGRMKPDVLSLAGIGGVGVGLCVSELAPPGLGDGDYVEGGGLERVVVGHEGGAVSVWCRTKLPPLVVPSDHNGNANVKTGLALVTSTTSVTGLPPPPPSHPHGAVPIPPLASASASTSEDGDGWTWVCVSVVKLGVGDIVALVGVPFVSAGSGSTSFSLETENGSANGHANGNGNGNGSLSLASRGGGYSGRVWVGSRNGSVSIWDVPPLGSEVPSTRKRTKKMKQKSNGSERKRQVLRPWIQRSGFVAHEACINSMTPEILRCVGAGDEKLIVITVGRDDCVRFWDALGGAEWMSTALSQPVIQRTYSTFRPLDVLICSWNVDAARPDTLTGSHKPENYNFLKNLLSSETDDGRRPDIIVFGFQEVIDLEDKKLTAKTVLLGRKGGKKDSPTLLLSHSHHSHINPSSQGSTHLSENVTRAYKQWHDQLVLAVRLAMPANDSYVVIHAESLVGLLSVVFVRASERARVSDVSLAKVKRGMGGLYGNKGGIVARLTVDDTSLAFINCHLAAGQNHRRQRNEDIAGIFEEKDLFAPSSSPAIDDALAYIGGGDGSMFLDHEICFLQGDLNYRIDHPISSVFSHIQELQFAQLLKSDQLTKAMKRDPSFPLRHFREAPINFAPTYKYDRNSNNYDSSEKKRAPAWCDRILWRAREIEDNGGGCGVKCHSYQRFEVDVSDHRPVAAFFRIGVKRVNHEALIGVKKRVQDAWREEERKLVDITKVFWKEGSGPTDHKRLISFD